VLTSYVGVTGLAKRITLDRILPNYFLKENKRCVNYRIIIGFFLLCISVLLVTKGNLADLAGVYTFSFLTVMALFGVGNLYLKAKRRKLPRPEKATIISVLLAIGFVVTAFVGNIRLNIESFFVFIKYLIPALAFIIIMLNRALIIKWLIYIIDYLYRPLRKFVISSSRNLHNSLRKINSLELVFFTKGDNVAILNRVMIYVEENETTKRLKIVHVRDSKETDNEALIKDLEVLDRAYPDIHIEFVEVEGKFGPDIIEELSKKWKIPKNFMLIGSPGNKFPYRVSELGGVRLIM